MPSRKESPEEKTEPRAHAGLAEETAPPPVKVSNKIEWVRIGPGGRIVIPAPMRHALGLGEGDFVQVRFEGGEDLLVVPKDVAVRRLQDLVAEFSSGDERSWVDLLIEDRKREFEAEERGE